MSTHAKVNLEQVKDVAPDFGMAETCQSRFIRNATGAERIGLAFYRMHPGRRLGFGHSHGSDEEMYLVLSGSGRFKVGDEVLDVGPRDVVYVPPQDIREWEAGPDGMELIAFGGHTEGETQLTPGWWSD